MPTYQGNLRKMSATADDPIRYQLSLGEDTLVMNDLIGQPLTLRFDGVIHCKICGRETKKSFGEGFCYPHFMNHPANSPCILRPELCEGHLGKGRDPEWEQAHHVQPHVVYLALSSAVKVGVTRETQLPTRWIDQGASQAIVLAEVPYRQLAGQIEVALKDHYTDKTSWQKMLKNDVATDVDLAAEKARAAEYLPAELQRYLVEDEDIAELVYPVQAYPPKVKSVNFDKAEQIAGTLTGIKGQYLLFDDNRVFNVRRHTGYLISLQTSA